MFDSLCLVKREDKDAARHAIRRLAASGEIKSSGGKYGNYRKIVKDENIIDWRCAEEKEFDLTLPMGIHSLVKIYPGNVIVVAGASNTGKTAFMLGIIEANQLRHDIYYFNSEMGAQELKGRLKAFGDVCPLDAWRFTAIERSSNFADVIRPDALNIIDFMEVYDDFWKVGGWIRDIHSRLGKGTAVIALQKKASTKKETNDYGRGGEVNIEKPRLYLSMDRGVMKIVKAKIWRKEGVNPNGLTRGFKLISGFKFHPTGDWDREKQREHSAV
jgi:hypothetical protein